MDFGNRINDAKKTSGQSYGSYNKYEGQANSAKGKFDSAMGSQKQFGDIYGDARNQYLDTDEINAARGTYQGARGAVDQINTTMNKLPESIRQQFGGTGMTEAQRQRAMQAQYSDSANTHNYLSQNFQNASQDYNEQMGRGMQEAQFQAGNQYDQQNKNIAALQSAWGTLLGQRNSAYGQYQTDLDRLAGVQGGRDAWEMGQQQMELERWKEQQANARSAADRSSNLELQKYMAGLGTGGGGPAPKAPSSSGPKAAPVQKQSRWDQMKPLMADGWQNVKDFGPLALFGGGSLWGR